MKKFIASLGILALFAIAGVGTTQAVADEKLEFSEAFMSDPAKFEQGKEIWFEQCTHCHGFKAYPGKAPKLKPARYKPEWVYKIITNGRKKMPAWEDVYDHDERMAIVAYIKHKDFSP